MKRLIFLIGFLLVSKMAWANIGFVQMTAVTHPGSTATCVVASNTYTTGNTLIVMTSVLINNVSVNSIAQSSGSNSYSEVTGARSIVGVALRSEVWVATNITGFTGTITVTFSSSTGGKGCYAVEYSPPVGGSITTGNANNTQPAIANPSQDITTQDSNNWCIGSFDIVGSHAYTSGTGNLRGSSASSGASQALVDNTVASPGTCTTSVTNAGTANWVLGAVELRASSGSTPASSPIPCNILTVCREEDD